VTGGIGPFRRGVFAAAVVPSVERCWALRIRQWVVMKYMSAATQLCVVFSQLKSLDMESLFISHAQVKTGFLSKPCKWTHVKRRIAMLTLLCPSFPGQPRSAAASSHLPCPRSY